MAVESSVDVLLGVIVPLLYPSGSHHLLHRGVVRTTELSGTLVCELHTSTYVPELVLVAPSQLGVEGTGVLALDRGGAADDQRLAPLVLLVQQTRPLL